MDRLTVNVHSDPDMYECYHYLRHSESQLQTMERITGVLSIVHKYASKRRFSDSNKQIFYGVTKKDQEHNFQLISYFANFNNLAFSNHKIPEIDVNYIESAINAGVDVNEVDEYGQTILHDAAGNWSTDIVEYLLQRGANVNAQDRFGRTPLHVAATADYPEMVEFLIQNGGDLKAITFGEMQTPVHYAAKTDSTKSLKALIRLGADYKTVKDYKQRTPLYLAAELDRSEAATVLIDNNAPIAERDYYGQTAIMWMARKMPKIAMEAFNSLHKKDKRKRKQEFYLDCLENIKNSLNDFSPPSLIA